MTTNTLSNIQSSLFKFCMDFAFANSLEFINFDAHANESEAPPGDLMGPAGLSLQFDDDLVNISVMFGVAVESDTNLFKLSSLMGQLLELLKPKKNIRVYDSDTGADIGWMVVMNGTRLLPVGGSQAKPLQYISVDLATNCNFNK